MEEEEEEQKQTLDNNNNNNTNNNNNNKIIIKIPTHKTSTTSGRLPLDALLHIWAHLPTTVLYRLRPVCHLWNTSLISDTLLPSLLRRNFHRHPPPPTLLLILRHLPDQPLKLPDLPSLLSTLPASSLFLSTAAAVAGGGGGGIPAHPLKNGFTPYVDTTLHLLPSPHRLSPLCCFASNRFFYLCNPSINQFLRLSPPQTPPETSTAAFGYFPLENRFVLVNISGTNAEILEFGPGQAATAGWSVIPDRAPVREFGLNIGGRFFWASADLSVGFVVCLEYKKREFKVIRSPEGNAGEVMMYDKMYIVEFKGAVCAVDNFSRPPHMEVWVLQGDDVVEEFNWVRKYNVLMTGMGRDVVYPFCDYYFYDNEDDEEKMKEKSEMIVLCNKTRSRLYCYNVKSRSNRLVYKPKQRSFEQLALYTPGFFPLIGGDSRVSK